MPLFQKGPTPADYGTFGKNVFLRSTQDVKTDSGMLAASTFPAKAAGDGTPQKILQPGTVLAKITSGAESGKLGPFSAKATDGRQTVANIVGINITFLPWQLLEGDREVAYAYEASVEQPNCIEFDADDLSIPLSDTTATAMVAKKLLSILFK